MHTAGQPGKGTESLEAHDLFPKEMFSFFSTRSLFSDRRIYNLWAQIIEKASHSYVVPKLLLKEEPVET
jgi:hypothetical protein